MNLTQPAPVRELENTIGYRFSDPELLTNALIHTSYVNEARSQGVREDNERLEFLGDSVLSLTVTDYLYRTSGLKEGVLTDEQLEKGMTEQEAVKKGLIRRDTVWVTAVDTLFGKGYDVDDMRYVPTTDKHEFAMDTATLTSGSGYTVKVFQCGVLYDDYLGDMDKQLVYNLKDKAEKMGKYAGLRVGSLTEINNNAGNWED